MNTMLRPESVQALQSMLVEAHDRRVPIAAVDLSTLDALVDVSPEDMTATVQTGVTVAGLQARLSEAGQWLPVDPPHPGRTLVADVLHHDLSGPRRFGYGTVREHVIGIAAVLADGRLVRSGGRVVKNVAGYDLARLLVGSGGTLGIIVEVTFKLRPLTEDEAFIEWRFASLDDIGTTLEAVLEGPTEPIVLDVIRMAPDEPWRLVAGFAGHPADVAWQVAQTPGGWHARGAPDYDEAIWSNGRRSDVVRESVLPSRLVAHLRVTSADVVVARAGNGVIYTLGSSSRGVPREALAQRVRDAFDPHGILAGAS
jgi:glycolate oxidase FAD binding subunit